MINRLTISANSPFKPWLEPVRRVHRRWRLAQMIATVDTVVWDLDGTLYANAELMTELRRHWQDHYDRLRTDVMPSFAVCEANGEDWWTILRRVDQRPAKELIIAIEKSVAKKKWVAPHTELVMYFTTSPLQHLVFSNALTEQIVDVLQALGLAKEKAVFSRLIGIDQLPAAKPAAAAFAYLETALRQLQAKRVLYVGDSDQHDIQPAAVRGWHTVHIARNCPPSSLASVTYQSERELFQDLLRLQPLLSWLKLRSAAKVAS